MVILLTGATGYIGKKLLPVLVEAGHHVICCVRDKKRFKLRNVNTKRIEILEIDFLNPPDWYLLPKEIDAAYYLIHSLGARLHDFESLELKVAKNFVNYMNTTQVKQVVYLSGITNKDNLSPHLLSRKRVGDILAKGDYDLTTLKAGVIVGSGSASFEIIRDLCEKSPLMVAPQWVSTRTQPICIRDVVKFLIGVLHHPKCMGKSFDIGGPDILTYKEMLLQYAEVRGLRRHILTVPVMTPRLSSYWLCFVTSTSYTLAVNLVNSMKIEVIAKDRSLQEILGITPIPYKEAIQIALNKIKQNMVFSSWKDAFSSSGMRNDWAHFVEVPEHGCFKDQRTIILKTKPDQVMHKIWAIGGQNGWYHANWLWAIRGTLDKMVGGVGLRRGRTHQSMINPGDALDFWRVLVADKSEKRLLLFAEMKLPGEAWLEFEIQETDSLFHLVQTATFRPKGVWGRLYWYLSMPLHAYVFQGMLQKITKG